MNRLTIRQKFIALIVGFIVTMLVSFIFAWQAAQPLQREWQTYVEQVAKRESLLMEMHTAFGYGGLIHNFKNYVLRGQDKYEERVAASAARLNSAISAYHKLDGLDHAEKGALNDIEAVAAAYTQQLPQVSRMISEGAAHNTIDAQVKIDDTPALQALETLHERNLLLTEQETARVNTGVAHISVVLAWVLAPSSLAGIALLLWLSRSITAPLSRFNDTIEQIRQTNDLSLRVAATSHDELGQASQAFDHMLGQFANILDQVNHSANDLASEIEQFSHTTEDTSASMESQRAQTEQIATAMNEMAATVHEVARNAESAAQAAGQADQASSQGNQVVQNTVSTIQTLASGIEQAAQVIHRLESDSDAIGAVLDVIKNIAEQTNLLALNAAIEAARAGDQGRGFAVVADEVRTLAQRTQESTAEIQSMIERLQAGASEAVKVMNNSSVQAAASVEQANSAGGALQMIIDKVGAITDMNTQIATAAEQQSMVAEEMNQNIVNISRATEQTAASAASTASSAERMVAVVEALTVSAGHFRTSNQSIDLEAAKARHLAWKTRMRSFLDGKSTMSIDQATSHRECALGKWYYSSAREQFAELPEIRELEHPHEQLHKLVKQIVTLKNQGQSKAAEAEYLKIGPLSDRIVAILDRIAHKMRAKSS